LTWLVAGGCLGLGACDGPGYPDGGGFAAGRITPRAQWTATGRVLAPASAVDGDPATAALGEGSYERAFLNIDLGRECLFNMVVINHGARETGHARRIAVLTSDDGKNYQRQAEAPGLRRVSTVMLPRAVLARYLRIEVVDPGDTTWAVGEVYIN